MNQIRNDYQNRTDVQFLFDGYELHKAGGRDPNEIRLWARAVTGLVNSHGSTINYLAILHQEDDILNGIFRDLGYSILTMNGNRPKELREFIQSMEQNISLTPPRKIIAVTSNPEYSRLFSTVQKKNIELGVWVSGKFIPNEYNQYKPKLLSELIPVITDRKKSIIRLDAENHLIGLLRKGIFPEPRVYIGIINTLVADFGDIVNIQAAADWERLRKMANRDYQREFEQLGVRTIYQINIPGKNSSDIALAGNIQEALERNSDVNNFIIGTGDSDFLPLIDAIHEHGKKAVVIALRNTLSATLADAADQVRYLDDAFQQSSEKYPTHFVKKEDHKKTHFAPEDTFIVTMQVANILDTNKWQYCYYNRLTKDISTESIRKAITAGYLRHRKVGEINTITLNYSNPTSRQIKYFVRWIKIFLHLNLDESQKEYCDTNMIHANMISDPVCKELTIGQTLDNALEWANAAATAKIVEKEVRYAPQGTKTIVETWWPAAENHPVVKKDENFALQEDVTLHDKSNI